MYSLKNIGIIVKIEENEAVVMTDDSVFIKIKMKQNMFPGQKILIEREDVLSKDRKNTKYYSVLAGIAAVIILVFVYSFLMNFNVNSTYAYINIDINPSMELEINSRELVVDVKSLNTDAEKLTEGMKVKGLNINQALKIIIDKSLEDGYLKKEKEKNYVLITVALDEAQANNEKKKLDDFLDTLKTGLEESYDTVISPKVVSVPPDYRKKARENNVSMGKYLIYSEAKQMGKEIPMEELRSEDLYSLLSRVDVEKADENELNTSAPSTEKPTPAPGLSYSPVHATAEDYPKRSPSAVNVSALVPVNTPIAVQKVESALCRGLKGEYYDNRDLTDLKLTRIDPEINFRWLDGSPDPIIENDTFSVRWTGVIVPRYSEKYTFSTYADDGVRLWVNNVLIIDDWKSHTPVTNKGSLDLVAGTLYDIRFEYFEDVKLCQVKLFWESKSQKSEVVPSSQLYHQASVYQAEKAVFSRSITENTNKGYTGDGYVNYINDAGSFVEWTVNVAKSGTYTLNFGYANGTEVNRPLEIRVNNNIVAGKMDFNSTSDWTNWRSNALTVNLNSGINIIRATAVTADGGPNIDYLEIL